MPKKYALLLCGQPRYRKVAIESIVKNIINCNEVDVYCNFWLPSNDAINYKSISEIGNILYTDNVNNATEYIKAFEETLPSNTVYRFENQIVFESDKYYPGTEYDRVIHEVGPYIADQHFRRCNFHIQSQWYSVMRVNELCKTTAQEINLQYDGIIRFRPDIFVPCPIILDKYDANKLNLPAVNDNIDEYGIREFEDPFAFGSPEIMDIYCNNYLYQNETLTHKGISALLSGYPLGVYLKTHLGYDKIVDNNFELGTHWTNRIVRV